MLYPCESLLPLGVPWVIKGYLTLLYDISYFLDLLYGPPSRKQVTWHYISDSQGAKYEDGSHLECKTL